MAKLPLLSDQASISTDVPQMPTRSIESAGMVEKASAQTFGIISNISSTLAAKRFESQVKNDVNVAENRIKKAIIEDQKTLDMKYAETDHVGYTDEAVSLFKEKKEALLSEAGSSKAREILNRNFNDMETSVFASSNAKENMRRSKFYRDKDISMIGEDANFIYKNPNPSTAADFITSTLKRIDSNASLYYPDQKDSLKRQTKKKLAESFYGGLTTKNNRGTLETALTILNGNDPSSSIINDGMSEQAKQAYRINIENKINKINREEILGFQREARKVKTGLLNGDLDMTNPEHESLVDNVKASIYASPAMDIETKNAMLSDMESDVIASRAMKEWALVPISERRPDQLAELAMTGEFDKLTGEAIKAEIKDKMEKVANMQLKQFRDDPAAYINNNDTDVRELSALAIGGDNKSFESLKTKMDTVYNDWNVPEASRKYATPAMKSYFKEQLNNAISMGDYKATASIFDNLESMAGNDSYKILTELGIDKKYQVIGNIDSGERVGFLKAMTNYKDLEKANDIEISKIKKDDLRGSDFYNAILNTATNKAEATAIAESFMDAAAIKALADKNEGKSIDSESPWRLFGNLQASKQYNFSGKIVIPGDMDSDDFYDYTKNFVKADNLKAMGIDINKEAFGEESSYRALESGAYFKTSPDLKGVYLLAPGGGPVMKGGKPIYKSFDELKEEVGKYKESHEDKTKRALLKTFSEGL